MDLALVGWWRFDEGTGPTAMDSSGHGNTGTLMNGPSWVAGRVGSGALAFDGIASHVDASNRPSLNNIPVKTVCAWIRPAATSASDQVFVGKDASAACGWDLSVGVNNEIRFRQCFSTDGVWASASNLAPVGEWHHIVLIYDRRSLANVPTLYVDGVEHEMAALQDPMGTGADESNRALGIGANAVDNTENFTGLIDEVRLYSRALSAVEVAQLP